jgi:ketosteroid isomerase-like protein
MLKRIILSIAMMFVVTSMSVAQSTEMPAKKTTTTPAKTDTTQTSTKPKNPASMSMLDTFNALLDGIRAANAKTVSDFYWRSPELVIFNSNGTVTKGWDQMSKNRESSYAKLKDVVLQERDVHARMFGLDYGAVSFLWTQSQTSDGVPDSASGRTTLIFRRVGKVWKIIHAHISPEAPDPSRVLKSEQAPVSAPIETPKTMTTP